MSQEKYNRKFTRRQQVMRAMNGEYAAEKVGSSKKIASALMKVLPKTTYEEQWKIALKMDEDYRKKIMKKGYDRLGAGCHRGQCKNCVFEGCIHDCHRGQLWLAPFSGNEFKGLRFMAWITTEQSSNNTKIA